MTNTRKILLLAAAFASAAAGASEVTYRNDIAPLIQRQCFECHDGNSPSIVQFKTDEDGYKKKKLGPRLDTYADLSALIVWPDTGALMRRLDDGSGTPDKKPGNMYKHLGETEPERQAALATLKAWIGEGGWNLNRWQKRGEVPAITKEQLDTLKLKY